MDSLDILSGRAVGELPLSIGTSLAIEALKDVQGYDSIWINVKTLYRNIYESCDREYLDKLEANGIADTISDEINFIRRHLANKMKVVIYDLGYKGLAKRYPKAILKEARTPLQIAYEKMMNETIDIVIGEDFDQEIEYDAGSELAGEPTKSLIITHYPVDLLSRTKFRQLRLLESHTGAIKGRSEWFSKLQNGREMNFVPFNKFTIQIFGDGKHFSGYPPKVKKAVMTMAIENRWTSVTTNDKVRFSIKRMKDIYTSTLLLGFL